MSEEQQELFVIETKIGPVEIPVDKYWCEYSEAERNSIRDIIQDYAESAPEILGECIEQGINIREMTNFKSFNEAKQVSNGMAVLVGDFGGQIYLTCPMKHIKCDEKTLEKLLREIDSFEWDCNEGDGICVTYMRGNPKDYVSGGMGGGLVEDGLWIHPDIADNKKELIRKVINGELASIN